jgi:two-component system KDP operon response regulator KdpE
MKVLVIDDESIIRRALGRALTSKGHTVVEAEDGESGLKIWLAEGPDLVFLDILMPGLSGLQVLSEVRKSNRAKVILMSAYTGHATGKESLEDGADMFVSKPFQDIFELVKTAEELVHGRTKS